MGKCPPLLALLQALLARFSNQRLLELSEAGQALGPGRGYAVSTLPQRVLQQVWAGQGSARSL